MNQAFYRDELYPFQDQVLSILKRTATGFYLTGGTAASRGYLDHRFSEDLDLFTNDDSRFALWADRVITNIASTQGMALTVNLREERLVRVFVQHDELALKIEMVNDVPSRVGMPIEHPQLGRIDSAENIFANKISAVIDRREPRDLADIWAFSSMMNLSIHHAIVGAQGKAAGIFPPDVARALCSVSQADWELVRWIKPPDPAQYKRDLVMLGESLLRPGTET